MWETRSTGALPVLAVVGVVGSNVNKLVDAF
jgi:hypothetical protein